MRYLVQAILVDNDLGRNIETVINSVKTDEPYEALETLMLMHKSSHSYTYCVLDLETNTVTKYENRYQ